MIKKEYNLINAIISRFKIDDFRYDSYNNETEYFLKVIHIKTGLTAEGNNKQIKSQLILREYLLLKLITKVVEQENNNDFMNNKYPTNIKN
jgi:hypothetical protein